MKYACVLLVALFATCAFAQRVRLGPCPEVKTNPSPFDFDKFQKIWFGLYKIPFGPTANYTCVYGRYNRTSVDTFSIQLGGITESGEPAANPVYPGTIPVPNEGRIDTQVAENFIIPYYVLNTDYVTYASFYGCLPLNSTHSNEVVFAMGRARNPDQSVKDVALQGFRDQNISLEGVVPNDQNNCPSVTE